MLIFYYLALNYNNNILPHTVFTARVKQIFVHCRPHRLIAKHCAALRLLGVRELSGFATFY